MAAQRLVIFFAEFDGMKMQWCSIHLVVVLICGQLAYGQSLDFFSPKISRDAVKAALFRHPERQEVRLFIAEGGEAELYVVGERSETGTQVYTLKKFLFDGLIEKNLAALEMFSEFQAEGLLGDIRVLKKLSFEHNELRSEYIEGQTLFDLYRSHADHPQFQDIWKRYIASLETTARNLQEKGYYVEALNGVLDGCSDLLNFSAGRHRSSLVVYSDPVSDDILFSVEPINILVEAKTGDLYLIDPL